MAARLLGLALLVGVAAGKSDNGGLRVRRAQASNASNASNASTTAYFGYGGYGASTTGGFGYGSGGPTFGYGGGSNAGANASNNVEAFPQQTPFPESCFTACPDLALVNETFGLVYGALATTPLRRTQEYLSAVAHFAQNVSAIFCANRALAECITNNPASCDAAMQAKSTRRLQMVTRQATRPRPRLPIKARQQPPSRALQGYGGYSFGYSFGYGASTTGGFGYGGSTAGGYGGGYGASTTGGFGYGGSTAGGYGGGYGACNTSNPVMATCNTTIANLSSWVATIKNVSNMSWDQKLFACNMAAFIQSCVAAANCCEAVMSLLPANLMTTDLPNCYEVVEYQPACSSTQGPGGGNVTGGPCKGDPYSWDAGYGACTTYSPGMGNNNWCNSDSSNGLYAYEVCPECGSCAAAYYSPSPGDATTTYAYTTGYPGGGYGTGGYGTGGYGPGSGYSTTVQPVPSSGACKGGSNWNAGFGYCDTYGPGMGNSYWCPYDMDSEGVYAYQACPQCGSCTASPPVEEEFVSLNCDKCRVFAWASTSICVDPMAEPVKFCANATMNATGFAFTLETKSSCGNTTGAPGIECTVYTDEANFFPTDSEAPCGTFALAQDSCTASTTDGAFFIRYGLAPLMLPVFAGIVPNEFLVPWGQWWRVLLSVRPYALASAAGCLCDSCSGYAKVVAEYVTTPALLMHIDADIMEGMFAGSTNGTALVEARSHAVQKAGCSILTASSCFGQNAACAELASAMSFANTYFAELEGKSASSCAAAGYSTDGSVKNLTCSNHSSNHTGNVTYDSFNMSCPGLYSDFCSPGCLGGGGVCAEDEILCSHQRYSPFGTFLFGEVSASCEKQSDGCPCDSHMEEQCYSSWPQPGMPMPPKICVLKTMGCSFYGYPSVDHGYGSTTSVWDGGYGGGYGWSTTGPYVYCPEQYCYQTPYTSNGTIDWNIWNATPTCATWNEGCPCHPVWELPCTSWGSSYCAPLSEGCYDPFDIDCGAGQKECKDEFSAFCWEASWGNCPLYCTSNETKCSTYGYDQYGMMNYSDYTEFCAPAATGCPCDTQFENKCTDKWGYSWCQAKSSPCPIYCGDNEQECWLTPYGSDGYPDWSLPHNQTCHPINETCPCHETFEEKCHDNWGTWCQTKAYGSCPVYCAAHEMSCWVAPYFANGSINYYASWTETCANTTDGCPCHSTWEKQCTSQGYKYCVSIFDECPVDCGSNGTCYHYSSGNESCAMASGCVCEANEIGCSNPDTGLNECYPSDWYPSGCPVTCSHNEMYCSQVSFDSTGLMLWTDFCADGDSNNWMCPVVCDNATAQKCGTPGTWDEHCVAKTASCPVSCAEQYCWVDNYDASGSWIDSTESCASWNETCPCGSNSVRCTDPFYGYSYCTATYWGCPLYCNPLTEKTCYPVSFTPEGLQDWNAPVTESCQNISQTCPCGANAKMCRWTDEWGYENEVCYPTAESCPVTCTASEQRCYITDYDANGYPGLYRETCVSNTAVCPCGTNSQQCHDPHWDYHYCYPLVDYWTNSTMRCPVYCTDEQDYCYSPSYDASGNWLSTEESCVPKGTPCQCTGQNSFACDFNEWGYSWRECLPLEGGFCPQNCPEGQVSCPAVEDYKPDGSWLGWSDPSSSCAANLDACPCGKEAKSCPGSTIQCIFKDEDCPVTCSASQKKCYLTDYTSSEEFISDREVCVASNATCPCGKNTQRCPGSNACLLASKAAIVCPCGEAERQCDVLDYTPTGKKTNITTQCVNQGIKCPCGKNTLTCADPNDADADICIPKFSGSVLNSCPKPCTPAQEAAGNETCIQTHLTETGDFLSETISCVSPANCLAGQNMQKCPSGAHIPTWKQCKDLYGVAGSNASAVSSGEKQTSTVFLTLGSTGANALDALETARIAVNGELYLPKGIQTDAKLKTGASAPGGRRLSRQLQSSGAVLTFEISNKGASSVSPSSIAEELKKQVKSGSAGVSNALSNVGKVDAKAGVGVATEKKTITTRAETVQQQKAAIAGIPTITTPTTTPGPAPTTVTTTTTEGGRGNPTTTTTTAGRGGRDETTASTTQGRGSRDTTASTTATTQGSTSATTTPATTTTTTADASTTTSTQETIEVTYHVVQVNLQMTVENPETITQNVSVVNAMRLGMAKLLNVSVDLVSVTFQTSRRLAGTSERQLATTLTAVFSVTFAEASQAETKRAEVETKSTEQAAQEINTVLTDVGYQGTVEVTGKAVAVVEQKVQVPVTTASTTSGSSDVTTSTLSSTEDGTLPSNSSVLSSGFLSSRLLASMLMAVVVASF